MSKAIKESEVAEGAHLITDKTVTYWCTQRITQALLFTLCRLRIRGKQYLPESGGAVFASNHQSTMDIPIIAAANSRHVCFLARETLAESKAIGLLMRETGAVLVKRGESDRKALRDMALHLKLGDLLAVFPEGTRTKDGSLGEFKRGAVLTAKMAGVPIIPTGITGAFLAMPKGKMLPRPLRVGVEFGPPIDPNAPDAQAQLVEAVQKLIGDGRFYAG